MMVWSPENAANAYLDALKLCSHGHQTAAGDAACSSSTHTATATPETESNELISALAAGMDAKLIVQVSPEPSRSTIALAAAARTTGGRVVCILPAEADAESLAASAEVVHRSGLGDRVEFKVGDAHELLLELANIDFSLVDCKNESYRGLLRLLAVNPQRAVVVASHLDGGREGLCGDVFPPAMRRPARVMSMKNLMGEGMEVTILGEEGGRGDDLISGRGAMRSYFSDEEAVATKERRRRKPQRKSRWVKKFDEESGEEHIFRIPNW